jgi:hypothetical protein
MTRDKLREARDYFSEKVSDVTRQLNLAGLAIIWIFRVGGEHSGGVPWGKFFLFPMLLLVISLGCDLGHYFYYAWVWDDEYRKTIKAKMEPDAEIPNWDSSTVQLGRWLFYAKVTLTVAAFAMLVAMIGKAML